MGSRVRILLKLGARVVAVEPQDECVETLKKAFRRNRHLTVVQKALGACEGHAEIMKTSVTTLSSLSSEWIDSVRRSGRFSQYDWNRRQVVPMTTLDSLIVQYGTPFFIKIDVEGFEYEVHKRTVSTSENALHRVHTRVHGIYLQLYWSSSPTWEYPLELFGRGYHESRPQRVGESRRNDRNLSGFTGDNKLSGDVYVQFSS